MSRDQRPGRVKMIDAGAPPAPARRIGDDPGTAIVDAAAPPPPDVPAPKAPVMLWSALFLIACIAGAAAVTLLPVLGFG